jgi:hypothetical protein
MGCVAKQRGERYRLLCGWKMLEEGWALWSLKGYKKVD